MDERRRQRPPWPHAQLLETAGIPFMVAGSFASTAHGLLRSTQEWEAAKTTDPRCVVSITAAER